MKYDDSFGPERRVSLMGHDVLVGRVRPSALLGCGIDILLPTGALLPRGQCAVFGIDPIQVDGECRWIPPIEAAALMRSLKVAKRAYKARDISILDELASEFDDDIPF